MEIPELYNTNSGPKYEQGTSLVLQFLREAFFHFLFVWSPGKPRQDFLLTIFVSTGRFFFIPPFHLGCSTSRIPA